MMKWYGGNDREYDACPLASEGEGFGVFSVALVWWSRKCMRDDVIILYILL